MPETNSRSPRSFAEVALELGLLEERHIRDALLVKQKLDEVGVGKALEDILIERGYISAEGIQKVERALKGDNQLGGFELVEKIGQGAMGAVFRAKQVSLDRIVAVKVLPRSLAEDPAFVDRFLREARNVARLNHPNIIQGIDAGEDRGYYYFAMEYVDGPTVRDIVEERGPLPEKEALEIILGVAKALSHAWTQHILHRDIKPANIMLTRDNTVKLCDLGLATALVHGDAGVSSEGKAVGTPYYISPEQAQGRTDIDTRSDIYSLGATLYNLLTGHPPFEGFAAAVVLSKHVGEKAAPIFSFRPDVSRNTTSLIAKMMAKDREHRHQQAEEVIEDIEDILSNRAPRHSIRFRQPSTIPSSLPSGRQTAYHTAVAHRKIRARKSNAASAVTLIILLLVGAAAAVAYFLTGSGPGSSGNRRNNHRPPPQKQPEVHEVVSPYSPSGHPEKPTQSQDVDSSGSSTREPDQETLHVLNSLRAAIAAGTAHRKDAIPRLQAISEDPAVSKDMRDQAGKLIKALELRLAKREAAEATARESIEAQIASGNLMDAYENTIALEQAPVFSREFINEMQSKITGSLRKTLQTEQKAVTDLLAKRKIDAASKKADSLRRRYGEAASALGLGNILTSVRKEIRKAEDEIRKQTEQRLVLLADAFEELRRSAGKRFDYKEGLNYLPPELPADLKNLLKREANTFSEWLERFSRAVAELDTVNVEYRGSNLRGRPQYKGPGRLQITTANRMIIGISLDGVEPDNLRNWMAEADMYTGVELGRALLFFGHDEEAFDVLDKTEPGDDLESLVRALKNRLRSTRQKKQVEGLLKDDPAGLSSEQCAGKTVEVAALLAQEDLAFELRERLEDFDRRLKSRLVSLSSEFLFGNIVSRGAVIEVQYDATSPHHFGDWRGIDGKQWRYSEPGLTAVGSPGTLTSGIIFSAPLSVLVQMELEHGGEISLEVSGVRLRIAADEEGVLSGGNHNVPIPPVSTGRHAFKLILDSNRARVDMPGRKPGVELLRPPKPSVMSISGRSVNLWGLRIEGVPSGPADQAQRELAACRKALFEGREVTWPVRPGLPGWVAAEGVWEYHEGMLKTESEEAEILAAVLLHLRPEQTLKAEFTAVYEGQNREWTGHNLIFSAASGAGSVRVGLHGRGSVLTAGYRRDTRRARIGRGRVESGEVKLNLNITSGGFTVEAEGESVGFDFEERLSDTSGYAGFLKSGGTAVFKDFKLSITP